jgi:hypothetical protein
MMKKIQYFLLLLLQEIQSKTHEARGDEDDVLREERMILLISQTNWLLLHKPIPE